MTHWGWLAAVVLFLQLPIPLYWFVMHPSVHFWRRHPAAGYITGLLTAWAPVTACLAIFHSQLFSRVAPPAWSICAGLGLILCDVCIFWRVKRDLGAAGLVGKTELSGGGEVIRAGIYGRMRHPRYAGSLLAILGSCFLAGTRVLWGVAGIWLLLMLAAILLEEREMRARFGARYEEYCRSVPRFVPWGAKPRAS
ncbi:MAG: isoprenylcysteine carboxylmethyltransferase family protein [Candidatus Acidiferrales bacterium]